MEYSGNGVVALDGLIPEIELFVGAHALTTLATTLPRPRFVLMKDAVPGKPGWYPVARVFRAAHEQEPAMLVDATFGGAKVSISLTRDFVILVPGVAGYLKYGDGDTARARLVPVAQLSRYLLNGKLAMERRVEAMTHTDGRLMLDATWQGFDPDPGGVTLLEAYGRL